MSYKNVFTGGAGEAASAEQVARQLHESQGIDPELYDDVFDEPRDPKIVNELTPEALNIAGNFLTPLFQNFQTVADQLKVSESPLITTADRVEVIAASAQLAQDVAQRADVPDELRQRGQELTSRFIELAEGNS
ncbi:hypothetical protein SAMN05444920_120116 [Nonomuraea solani]|uniref:Uncharacterized protein n=1 Tax=Nonomuraea solani TaxID=1144553 RepID=A0A1H6EUE4_9ACTN|nr:hypothetical protein [Nonomuraea solani]SEH01412.1 hypothetical protein SAMN05444920_120116 [Nonomuraea solani]